MKRIGYYESSVDSDPQRTREALSRYKEAKGFLDQDLWSHVTQQTVIFMVQDYAEILRKEFNG